MAAAKGAAIHSGMLTKKGGIRHNWLERHCELVANGELRYYERKKDKTLDLKGVVHLVGALDIRASTAPGKSETELEVETVERIFRFRAPSVEERDEWLAVLQAEAPKAKASGVVAPEAGVKEKLGRIGSKKSYKLFEIAGVHGTCMPHSDESFVCLDVVVDDSSNSPPDGFKKNSLDAKFEDNMTCRLPTSTKVKRTLGVTRGNRALLRCATEGEGIKLSTLTADLDGLDVSLSATSKLDVMLCTYMPICAPCGLYKDKSVKISSQLSGKPVVIQPACRLVDLYLSVDGRPCEHNKFCYSEGNLSNEDAKAKAMEQCYSQAEYIKEQIQRAAQGGTPWVTLFNKDSFNHDHFVYLPLMIPQGGDTDSVMVDEVKQYGEGLLLAWAQLLGEIGPGKHTFELRISPRCVINPVPGEGDSYEEELCLIEGYGQAPGLNNHASPGTVLRCNQDPEFNAFCKVWEGKDITPDPENPLFKATFTLNLDPAICSGRGPERKVEEFDAQFNDDIAEYAYVSL
jgi:hypothetical protein